MKFATKATQQCPPRLRYVATLPRDIKNANMQIFCKYSEDMEKMQTNCIFSALILIPVRA